MILRCTGLVDRNTGTGTLIRSDQAVIVAMIEAAEALGFRHRQYTVVTVACRRIVIVFANQAWVKVKVKDLLAANYSDRDQT